MLNIPGYVLTEIIYTGTSNILYRGISNQSQQQVILKTIQSDYPTLKQISHLKQEYRIMTDLNVEGVVKVYGLENHHHHPVLVLEDFGGQSLKQWLLQESWDWNEPESKYNALVDLLTIAVKLTKTLAVLHEQKIIHKDIKPANIIINPYTKQIKLTDFSIASRLDQETAQLTSLYQLEGSLPYMAPEQTGRMNRCVDCRSDFYAFGVTLYEMFTGQLPFQTKDVQELVYAHLAQQPIPVQQVNPQIPSLLSAVIEKLMAKNAEDRYQSAAGLLADLERCLELNRHFEIPFFVPGECDRLGQLRIPQKLYGREQEVATLLLAFDHAANLDATNTRGQLVLVSGYSGIGKTSVVNEVHKSIVRQRGYFISGKFDQFQRNIPYAPFVQAFRALVRQFLLESLSNLQQWKDKLKRALGANAQVLIDVMPDLELILGEQPPLPVLSAVAAQARFNNAFQAFIQVFAQPEHPLVLFLDDLQWADSATLDLMQVLMANQYFLLIGAYRDNEVSPIHPLIKTIKEIEQTGTNVEQIVLRPLELPHVEEWLKETLQNQSLKAISMCLAELLFHKTQGNPFCLTQLLKTLHHEKLVQFDFTQGCWKWDITQIQATGVADKQVVELVASNIVHLPSRTQTLLQFAACIGAYFNLEVLVTISNLSASQVAEALQPALQVGLVLPLSPDYRVPLLFADEELNVLNFNHSQVGYRFLHDRVQQAAYSLIKEADKQITHLKIGQSLLEKTPKQMLEAKIFDIVNQLNVGISSIQDIAKKDELAHLNLIAGRKAKAAAAYEPAVQYLRITHSLLTETHWNRDYCFMLESSLELAEAYYLITDFEHSESLGTTILYYAKNILDCVKVYELQIDLNIARGQQVRSVEIGCKAVEQLGITLIRYSGQVCDLPTLPAISHLATMPKMHHPHQLASLRILSKIAPAAYQAVPLVYPDIVLTAVQLCLQHGHSSVASYIYGAYSAFLQSIVSDPAASYHAGQIAFQVLEQYPAKELEVKVYMVVSTYASPGKIAVREILNPLTKAIHSGLETGNLAHASLAIIAYCTQLLLSGEKLETIQKQQLEYIELLEKLKQTPYVAYARLLAQWVDNMQCSECHPWQLVGQYADEAELTQWFEQKQNYQALFTTYVQKGIAAYLFGQYNQAISYFERVAAWHKAALGLPLKAAYYFYYSLALLASEQNEHYLEEQVQHNQACLQHWATQAPMNYQHKYDLVAAELARLQGQLEAIEYYDRAIAGAKENGYLPEVALSNELAAKFYLNWGKEKVAAGYMQEAYYCYASWGAIAKTDDMEKRYPDLLRPILQKTVQTINPFETLTTIAIPNITVDYLTKTNNSSSKSINTALDFAAILKASQALSSTIQLEKLLYELTQIILQNSGADRCALILPNEDKEWYVEAIATQEKIELCSEPLENNPNLPTELIRYVKNTQEIVVIDDLKTDLPVISEYLVQQQPKSILCLPLLNQGNLQGILYLKNHLISGVFTSDRILILNFLCTQAAISLKNARLYAQQQQTQLQMVQNEKMASLGNLVAGVAHEINNPIGFLNGSINNVKEYVEDLIGHLKLYQKHYSPVEAIQKNALDIDLEFLAEDLPTLLDTMTGATNRIKSISTSLRTFSRADTGYKETANIHEGIDSTLLILKYRLKANENRPAINIHKEYGEIPQIECFPGQLNQVFMNLLANGIDTAYCGFMRYSNNN